MRTIQLDRLSIDQRRVLLGRSAVPDRGIRAKVAEIAQEVRRRGQEAVEDYAQAFGGGFRRLGRDEVDRAITALDPAVRAALDEAAAAIATFHARQLPETQTISTMPGVEITRRWTPLRRVGVYVPGGSAPLPSTALMTIIPARLAGVREIVAVSPERADAHPNPLVTAAARLAGATDVWYIGGAQAIAALAYGAGDLAPVDKIVGPGNAWVTAAKLAVFGDVAIDLPAGPSEVLVLADETATPRLVAIDLLCQAEHGPDSPAILVTTDPTLPGRVQTEIDALLAGLEPRGLLGETLEANGLALIAPDRDSAIDFTQEYAAEHVTIATADPEGDAARVTAAGSVYIGPWSAESAGDYATGANHVLPTGGLAAACSPLQVEDFGSWRQEQ
ncbi:MAG: histidinol dehydrogenase, partial [Acidimicrobiia bacterium]